MPDHDRPYHRFAKIYDRMGGDRFSEKMVAYTNQLLKRYKYQPESILDLCCGTGTAAIQFAEIGYKVAGLDGSESMLKMARQKARYKNKPIRFYHQHLPQIDIKSGRKRSTFDLVTCFYDSLNYLLTETKLKSCFQNVENHLKPGGLFIFDMNTLSAFKNVWMKTYAGCQDEIAWIFESKVDNQKKIADLTATFFTKKGLNWKKFSEIHQERAYSNTVIKKLLRQAGLEAIGLYKCFKFTKPDLKTARIAVVAQKK